MTLSLLFRYSCVQLHTCSLWILFQTASFISFMLISHGYCIMYERLSIRERRTTAGLGCLLYLRLIGYKAAFPYFTVIYLSSSAIICGCSRISYLRITMIRNCALIFEQGFLLMNYFTSFYIIFCRMLMPVGSVRAA